MIIEEVADFISGELKKHPEDFLILAIFFILAIVNFWIFSYDHTFQKWIIFATGAGYFLWGVFHHWRKKDLCMKIALDYFLVSALGVTAAIFVLLRG